MVVSHRLRTFIQIFIYLADNAEKYKFYEKAQNDALLEWIIN